MSVSITSTPADALARALRARAAGQSATVCARIAAAHKVAWSARLRPDAYVCRKEGGAWVAVGPCDQRFEYRKVGGAIECLSHSGETYTLAPDTNAGFSCSCRNAAAGHGCKHAAGLVAVYRAAR